MKATASYLLMLQEYINSKRKTLLCSILCLGSIKKDFTIDNMQKKRGLK